MEHSRGTSRPGGHYDSCPNKLPACTATPPRSTARAVTAAVESSSTISKITLDGNGAIHKLESQMTGSPGSRSRGDTRCRWTSSSSGRRLDIGAEMKAAMSGRLGWLWILAAFTVGFGAIVETRAIIIVCVTLMVLIIITRRLDGGSNGVRQLRFRKFRLPTRPLDGLFIFAVIAVWVALGFALGVGWAGVIGVCVAIAEAIRLRI